MNRPIALRVSFFGAAFGLFMIGGLAIYWLWEPARHAWASAFFVQIPCSAYAPWATEHAAWNVAATADAALATIPRAYPPPPTPLPIVCTCRSEWQTYRRSALIFRLNIRQAAHGQWAKTSICASQIVLNSITFP
jgi:hypothetical protein